MSKEKTRMSPTECAHHILEGNERRLDTDYPALHEQLHDEAKHLKFQYMRELINFARFLRARQGGTPYAPSTPERPPVDELGPCKTLTPDKPPVASRKFLPDCKFQYKSGKVVKCDNPAVEHYLLPCSKGCKTPVSGFNGSTGKRAIRNNRPTERILEIVDEIDGRHDK